VGKVEVVVNEGFHVDVSGAGVLEKNRERRFVMV
jgi:hypothetical protein